MWQGILIDGHNRYAIAQKHNLPFKTVAKVFDDRTDAKIWILKNQLGRRNLIPAVRIKIALLVEQTIAQKAKAKMLAGVKADPTDICPEGSADKPSPKEKRQAERENTTNYQLAKMAGVSHDTIAKVEKIEKQAAPEIKAAVTSSLTTYPADKCILACHGAKKRLKKFAKCSFQTR